MKRFTTVRNASRFVLAVLLAFVGLLLPAHKKYKIIDLNTMPILIHT